MRLSAWTATATSDDGKTSCGVITQRLLAAASDGFVPRGVTGFRGDRFPEPRSGTPVSAG